MILATTINREQITAFQAQLTLNIRKTIAKLKQHGTKGMGLANLLQVTPTPNQFLSGSPDTELDYKLLFAKTVKDRAEFRNFLVI